MIDPPGGHILLPLPAAGGRNPAPSASRTGRPCPAEAPTRHEQGASPAGRVTGEVRIPSESRRASQAERRASGRPRAGRSARASRRTPARPRRRARASGRTPARPGRSARASGRTPARPKRNARASGRTTWAGRSPADRRRAEGAGSAAPPRRKARQPAPRGRRHRQRPRQAALERPPAVRRRRPTTPASATPAPRGWSGVMDGRRPRAQSGLSPACRTGTGTSPARTGMGPFPCVPYRHGSLSRETGAVASRGRAVQARPSVRPAGIPGRTPGGQWPASSQVRPTPTETSRGTRRL